MLWPFRVPGIMPYSSEDKWMANPPYGRGPENGPFGEVQWRARCQCQRVEYEISRREPLDSKFCHCNGCQTLHGAPFQWAAIFHKDDVQFVRGHDSLYFYNSSTMEPAHSLPCKISCSNCHSLIMDEGRHVLLLYPELIKHDTGPDRQKLKEIFYPKSHMFYSQRVVDIPDGKPKWTGINGSSELMEGEP